jgi:hypothetical protein
VTHRKKVLGLAIGPKQPSLAQRLVKPALVAGAGAAAVATTRLIGRRGTNGAQSDHGSDPSAQARSARADMQHHLKSGDLSLEEALRRADEDEALGRTKVKILLQNLPGVGARGAVNAMEELGIDPNRRVKGLGNRQREELLERFGN